MSLYNFSCLGHFPYGVIPLFLEGKPPSPRSTPWGAYRPAISYEAIPLFSFGLSMQYSFTHSLIADKSMVVGHVLMDHTFFYVHQSYRHDSTHPGLFMSWGALWEPLHAHIT